MTSLIDIKDMPILVPGVRVERRDANGEVVAIVVDNMSEVSRTRQVVDRGDDEYVVNFTDVPGYWQVTMGSYGGGLFYGYERIEPVVVPTTVWRIYRSLTPRVRPRSWRISCDFDSVIHKDPGLFTGCEIVEGGPNPGAVDWLNEMLETPGVEMVINTCRFTQDDPRALEYRHSEPAVIEAGLRAWLLKHGVRPAALAKLDFWHRVGKPTADIYIDDKAFAFCGEFPSLLTMQNQMTYNKARRLDRGCE